MNFVLKNNALSVEEFHGKLQAATNFPLRPFALPFLKVKLFDNIDYIY
jgi:hypothetical protein